MESGRPLVFDLDGTLWDTTEVVARAWSAALEGAGLGRPPMTAVDIASIMGLTHEQIRARLFGDLSPERWEEFSRLCYRHEEDLIGREGGILYSGAVSYTHLDVYKRQVLDSSITAAMAVLKLCRLP